MLCFGRRKKCFEKGDDEDFVRLQEEPPSLRHADVRGKHYNNNISHVISKSVLVANGKPLQVFKTNESHKASHRTEQSREYTKVPTRAQGYDLHFQKIDYKHLQNRNNIYRPGKNIITVQRSASANYPIRPHVSQREPVRLNSRVPDGHYARKDDVHFDWVVRKDTVEKGSDTPRVQGPLQGTRAWRSTNDIADNDDLKQTLAHLDDTLNSFCIDGLESDDEPFKAQTTVNQIKNYPMEKEPSTLDSGIDSTSESLSSETSRQGGLISNNTELKTGIKRTSVSFQLPADHVDKPYSPMQFTKPKSKSSSVLNITAPNHSIVAVKNTTHVNNVNHTNIVTNVNHNNTTQSVCIWDNQTRTWHRQEGSMHRQENGTDYVYPFRGSFPNLFYGKYLNGDMKSGIIPGKSYLAPGILNRIESLESVTDFRSDFGRSSGKQNDNRRHSEAYY